MIGHAIMLQREVNLWEFQNTIKHLRLISISQAFVIYSHMWYAPKHNK